MSRLYSVRLMYQPRQLACVSLLVLLAIATVGCDIEGEGEGSGNAVEGVEIPMKDSVCGLPPLNEVANRVVYVCDCAAGADAGCVPGDDGNDGFSPLTPKRSDEAARIAFNSAAPGDVVALCRGGAFFIEGSTRLVNSACRADNRCILRDYAPPWGSDQDPAPLITSNDGAIALEDGGNANHEEGYVIANLRLRGAGSGDGVFVFNDIDDVLLCNLDIAGFGLGVHVAGSNTPDPDSDGENARVVLRASRVTDNAHQGWLGSCDGCAIEDSYFMNNGFDRGESGLNHNIYISASAGRRTQGIRVVGNELHRSAIADGQCAGVSLVVHGEHEGLLVEDNLVQEALGAARDRCWGIAVDTGYDAPEGFQDIAIRANTVANVGNVAIGANACSNCLIENNTVIQNQAAFHSVGIAVPSRSRAEDDQAMDTVTVRNNSVYFGEGAHGSGIRLQGEGHHHVVVSNAIHYAGNSEFTCFELGLPSSQYAAVDNNLCYYPAASAGEWVATFGQLSNWQTTTGFDLQSVDDDDPLFNAPHSLDLSPSSSQSPMVNAGHLTLSSPSDRNGNLRDASPDMGAYEFSN